MKCMHGLGVYKNQTGYRYQGIFKIISQMAMDSIPQKIGKVIKETLR